MLRCYRCKFRISKIGIEVLNKKKNSSTNSKKNLMRSLITHTYHMIKNSDETSEYGLKEILDLFKMV